jgi:hypothetical protein
VGHVCPAGHERVKREIIRYVDRSFCKVPIIFPDSNETRTFFRQIFEKS